MKKVFKIILSYLLISFNTYVFSIENKDDNLLKIGVLAPFSGEFKDIGKEFLNMIQQIENNRKKKQGIDT